jgi:multiple sugar transport system substrate-binding protein
MTSQRPRGRATTFAPASGNLSRRDIIRYGGALGLAAATVPLLNPTVSAAQDAAITITTNNAPAENQPEAVKAFEQTIARYEEAHPNITVEASQDTWDPQTFPARLAAGTLSDAFVAAYTEPQGIIGRGQAANVTTYLKQWPYFSSFTPESLAVVRDGAGELYGFTLGGYLLGLLYNRDHFTEAGLNPDQPPATWDELRTAAKTLTANGRAGFVETSSNNQGGWHFVAWMYSAGGEVISEQDGKYTAIFNNDTGVEVLQFLKDMRYTDKSMPERQLLDQNDTRQLMATGQVSMCVQAADSLPYIRDTFADADINQFGLSILPQNGGNATLAGGTVWMFNPKSSPEVLAAAVDFSLFREFDLTNLEASLQADQKRGALIGWPQLPIFTGEFQAKRQAVFDKYSNAPVDNYRPFVEGAAGLALRAEPPIETQQLYAAIDAAVQAILTDESADPRSLLDQAAQQFQTQVLDPINAG